MRNWKISLDLRGLSLGFRQAVELAARAGLDAVEIEAEGPFRPEELSGTGVREIRNLLSTRNLRLSAVGFRSRRGLADPAGLDARIAATKDVMQLAYQLGARVVIGRIGQLPSQPEAELPPELVEVLGDLARHSDRVGASLAVETTSESPRQLLRLLDRVPEGAVGVDFNPAEMILAGRSPLEAIEVLGRRVLHVHAADATDEAGARPAQRVELGRGAAEMPILLAHLEGLDYRSDVAIGLAGTAAPETQIARALRILRP